MSALLVLGGWLFWIIVAAEIVLLFVSAKKENIPLAWISLCLFTGVMYFMGFDVWHYVKNNPYFLLACFGGYMVLGFFMSLYKWSNLSDDIIETFEKMKDKCRHCDEKAQKEYLARQSNWKDVGAEVVSEQFAQRYVPLIISDYSSSINQVEDIIPKLSQFKATITYWISFWPIHLFWLIFHEMIERICNAFIRHFRGLFEGIARRKFARIKNEFPVSMPETTIKP